MTDRDDVGKYQPGHNQPGPGRPSVYREYYAELALKFCLLGATDAQLAEFFNVSESTIYVWKHEYPAFLEAIDRGKAVADGMVAESLFKRATGYTTSETHVSNYQGQSRQTELIKHYPLTLPPVSSGSRIDSQRCGETNMSPRFPGQTG